MNNNLFIITSLKLFSKKIAKAKNYIPVRVALDYYRISILSVCFPTKNLWKRKEKNTIFIRLGTLGAYEIFGPWEWALIQGGHLFEAGHLFNFHYFQQNSK